MKMRAMTACLLIGIAALAACAETPSTQQLIERLGSKRFSERKEAAALLRERGPNALPELRKALAHADQDIRQTAASLIAPIESIIALAPKRFDVKARNQLLSEVLEQLGKQAQATFQVEEEDDRDLVTLDLKNATFWEAMDALGRATGRINDSANRDKPQIDFERKARRPRLVYNDGSFRVELRSISASRQIDLSEVSDRSEPTPQPRQLRLNFDARSAPHLSILAVDHIEIEQADDENGKPLMVEPIDAGGLNETPVFIESMRVDLNKVTDASRRLSRCAASFGLACSSRKRE